MNEEQLAAQQAYYYAVQNEMVVKKGLNRLKHQLNVIQDKICDAERDLEGKRAVVGNALYNYEKAMGVHDAPNNN